MASDSFFMEKRNQYLMMDLTKSNCSSFLLSGASVIKSRGKGRRGGGYFHIQRTELLFAEMLKRTPES